jgi:DNA-binding transcriptional regulator LsrR (DeoR family)
VVYARREAALAIRQADQIIHKAAWLYYAHGLRQDEVARELDISRASVATYLRKARETGMVTIATSAQRFAEHVAARQIEDIYGLEAVWVVPPATHVPEPSTEVPIVGANVFLSMIEPGFRVGVAWGRTVYTIADLMPHADLQSVTVVQLCGNLGSPYAYRPDECTMEIARRLNAKGVNFYAPLVLSTERLAAELREEAVIREQFARISQCDVALFSVGSIDADSHVVRCGALEIDELDSLRDIGAAGVIAGRIIDQDGRSLDCAYNRRIIAAGLDSLRAIPRRLAVVQEENKLEPLCAAIKGGLCTHLVVSMALAERLLASSDPALRARPAKVLQETP